jgi:MOSC domain-containing protein YiiM
MKQFTVLGVSISQGGLPKWPQNGPVMVTVDGLEGDQHRHTQHGGPDKAVCVFAESDYQALEDQGFKPMNGGENDEWDVGAMGENLTLDFGSWDPLDICIGDTLFNDNLVLQVSEPRRPCFNLAAHHPDLEQTMRDQMRAGFLSRVHKAGVIRAGDALTWVYGFGMSLRRCNQLYLKGIREGTPEQRQAALEILLKEPSLSESFKAQARKKAVAKPA